ncbi:MAG: hypothetical protein KKD18_01435 [Nanoarchaeota archaeon]|nr:hypothetical protein [Nanoarchaeota archaeon]
MKTELEKFVAEHSDREVLDALGLHERCMEDVERVRGGPGKHPVLHTIIASTICGLAVYLTGWAISDNFVDGLKDLDYWAITGGIISLIPNGVASSEMNSAYKSSYYNLAEAYKRFRQRSPDSIRL